MRISDWSSDVCSSDLRTRLLSMRTPGSGLRHAGRIFGSGRSQTPDIQDIAGAGLIAIAAAEAVIAGVQQQIAAGGDRADRVDSAAVPGRAIDRSGENTTELQTLQRNSYAVIG